MTRLALALAILALSACSGDKTGPCGDWVGHPSNTMSGIQCRPDQDLVVLEHSMGAYLCRCRVRGDGGSP